MATGNAKRFVEIGVAPRLARELAAQITAGVGNTRRLVELGLVPDAAKRIAALFSGTAVSNNALAEAGVIPRWIREIKAQAGGGTTPAPIFTTQPSISPSSGTAGQTFTANDGAASNASGYTRRWLLSGTAIGTGTTVVPATAGSLVLEVTATGPGGNTAATSGAVTVSAAPVGPPSTITATSRPSSITYARFINNIKDSTGAGVGAPTGSDPVTQLRALITTGPSQTAHLQGEAAGVVQSAQSKVGQGGKGGDNSAQGLARMQNTNTNYPAEMNADWEFSFGLNDYLPSVTPATRPWADNVRTNYASMAALVPGGYDYCLLLTPPEANVAPGQQFSADHVYHRRDMRSLHGYRAIDQVRALRLVRVEDTATPILTGGADEKALYNGSIPYSYRGTGSYSGVGAGTDYADGDRVPVYTGTATPSNSTDLGYDDGSIWVTVNGAVVTLYRKTGANGAGGWAQSDPKHQGRVGYGKVASIERDFWSAVEGVGPPFAPPQEFRCAINAASGAAVGTIPMKGTPTVSGLYDAAGNLSTLFSVDTAGNVTRTATGSLADGVYELTLALTDARGTLHSAVDIYVTRATGTAPAIRTIATPGVNLISRSNHGLVNSTALSFAFYLQVNSLASVPTIALAGRNANLASSPATPQAPFTLSISSGGSPRLVAYDTANNLIANVTGSGASLTAGVPAWVFLSVDFANNLRAVYVNDAAVTFGAVTSGTVPLSDAIFSFLMGAGPNQYYDGATPLVGGIGYAGMWDGYVDWSVQANRRALLKADGTPEVRTPYAAIGGLAPKLELFGSKGDWLFGTPDGSNGPQTMSISHRARSLMG